MVNLGESRKELDRIILDLVQLGFVRILNESITFIDVDYDIPVEISDRLNEIGCVLDDDSPEELIVYKIPKILL